MYLSISVIMYELTKYTNCICNYQEIPTTNQFCGIKAFDKYADYVDSDYIYLITLSDVQTYRQICLRQNANYLCLNNETSSYSYEDFHSLKIAEIQSLPSFETTLNHIIDIFIRFQNWDKNVHIALLKNADAQEIIDLCEPFFNCSYILFGPRLNVLAYTRNHFTDYPGYNAATQLGYTRPSILEETGSRDIVKKITESKEFYIIQEKCIDNHTYYNIHHKYTFENKVVGFGGVFGCQTPPSANYLALLSLLFENIQLYFQNQVIDSRNYDIYETFFCDLFNDNQLTHEKLQTQISYLPDLHIVSPYILAKLSFYSDTTMPLRYYIYFINNNIKVRSFLYHNELYILKTGMNPQVPTVLFDNYEWEVLQKELSHISYSIGISNEFFNIAQLSQAKIQCDQALKFANYTLNQNSNFVYYKDIHFLHLASLAGDSYLQMLTSSGDYQRLKNYDALKEKENLCDVFMYYIKNHCSSSATAKDLYMHQNTVLNKLRKIREIINTDISNPDTQAAFTIAYRIDHMNHDFKF